MEPTGIDAITATINTQFGDLVTSATTVLGSVAVAALVLFGGIYAWKYGKKVFSVISK